MLQEEDDTRVGAFMPARIPGLKPIHELTRGDPRVRIAVIDGPFEPTHEAFRNALLEVPAYLMGVAAHGPALRHGTAMMSILFGQPGQVIEGIAPGCRGLNIPVLHDMATGNLGITRPGCSQGAMAAAIDQAVAWNAAIINISAGQYERTGEPHPFLLRSLEQAIAAGALVIAAAGNDGCACLHIPASVPGVLVVGAHDPDGRPLPMSNFAPEYRDRGLLAWGSSLLAASTPQGVGLISGTSAATAVVTGIASLILSMAHRSGIVYSNHELMRILLDSRVPVLEDHAEPGRAGMGRLDLSRVRDRLIRMKNDRNTSADAINEALPMRLDPASPPSQEISMTQEPMRHITASDCGCAECAAKRASNQPVGSSLIYALGQLGYDCLTEARRDSLTQHMSSLSEKLGQPAQPLVAGHLLAYLEQNPWDAGSVLWTLNLDQTPIYGIIPNGPFAATIYERLREAFREQTDGLIERVSIPGRLTGQARLLNGQVVPVVEPELRGLYSWNTSALLNAICGTPPPDSEPEQKRLKHLEKTENVRRFLDRVYYELRNLGVTSQDRAINYAATNAFHLESVYEKSLKEAMDLDSVHVEKSPICRPDSDCWDVVLAFFYPGRPQPSLRRLYRFTVDVSDIVPVLVGPVRDWYTR